MCRAPTWLARLTTRTFRSPTAVLKVPLSALSRSRLCQALAVRSTPSLCSVKPSRNKCKLARPCLRQTVATLSHNSRLSISSCHSRSFATTPATTVLRPARSRRNRPLCNCQCANASPPLRRATCAIWTNLKRSTAMLLPLRNQSPRRSRRCAALKRATPTRSTPPSLRRATTSSLCSATTSKMSKSSSKMSKSLSKMSRTRPVTQSMPPKMPTKLPKKPHRKLKQLKTW
mmetsp:Transcript_9200/g.15667  ORF Transcript_9200/g.15667 Transcript_9200/m.15667 type:complete len:230 (+) Transcript_9200:429-1118(+)